MSTVFGMENEDSRDGRWYSSTSGLLISNAWLQLNQFGPIEYIYMCVCVCVGLMASFLLGMAASLCVLTLDCFSVDMFTEVNIPFFHHVVVATGLFRFFFFFFFIISFRSFFSSLRLLVSCSTRPFDRLLSSYQVNPLELYRTIFTICFRSKSA